MIILAISDLHGESAGLDQLAPVLEKADLVLVSGDITNFGGRKEAEALLSRLEKRSKRLLAVPGNCDRPEVGACLTEMGISLDCRSVEVGGLVFLGLGGSLPCPGRTPTEYSDEELAESLESVYREMPKVNPFILLCHQPPQGTKVDRVLGGLHVGSRAVRRFIEQRKPLACFCGHIHESAGLDMIGTTTVANPGPLPGGGFIRAEWDGINLRVELAKQRQP